MRPAWTATYRLQLHAGVGLVAARRLVPYLARLGVSHLYASPLLVARRESRHGYDVVDPTRLDPKLGAPADLDALRRGLDRHAMGLVVDVVPNHMAVGPENRFWEDVLAHGEASRHARWFDIAWRSADGRPRPLRLPVLGDVRTRVLARGEIKLAVLDDRVRVHYGGASFPIDPATLVPLVAEAARRLAPARAARDLDAVAGVLAALPSRDAPPPGPDRAARAEVGLARLARLLCTDAGVAGTLGRILAGLRGAALGRFLERQPYRLVHWRRAAGDVNYRRFFAVSELVGLRVEDPAVFAATHARLLTWCAAGVLDGLRIDHVDGLADPLGYLERLRLALDRADGRDVVVLVEKILTGAEQLRPEWPVAGTTGYEVANLLDALFVEPHGFAALLAWYQRRWVPRGQTPGFREVAWRAKRDMATSWLAPDVRRLAELFGVASGDRRRRPGGRVLADAITELLVCVPVYRTYVDGRRGSPVRADRAVVLRALADARRRGRADPTMLRRIAAVLLAPGALGPRAPFVHRFQQVSAALMAKGVEDTALYRWVPLASRNDVGGDPSAPLGDAVARFHAANARRARGAPGALSTTTTHDSKRSADVRARLHVLAEMPAHWTACVARWHARHRPWRRRVDGRLAPDAATEYLFYQTAVGIWPLPGAPAASAAIDAVGERVRAYLRKAVREAALRTSWLAPVPAFEAALDAFAGAVLASPAFRADVGALVARIARPGLWTALARTLVHLTAPGVPDLYQGDELWRFMLVDPDNRGDVDFARRAELLAELETHAVDAVLARRLMAHPESGAPKLHVVRCALALRRHAVDVFRGAYVPLERGAPGLRHVVAFARTAGSRAALTIAPRLVLSLCGGRFDAPIGPAVWGDATLRIPRPLGQRGLTNVLTGERLALTGGELRLADALATFPVALCWSEG